MSTEQNNKAFAEVDEVEAALRGLKRVEAPANFDMRLKARIADRQSSRGGYRLGFLKIAAPATLTVAAAVSGYVLWQQPADDALPGIDQVAVNLAPVAASSPETTSPAAVELTKGEPTGEPANTTVASRQPQRATDETTSRAVGNSDSGGASVDRALGGPEETIYPRGIQPSRPVDAIPVMPDGSAEIAVEEVLSLLGIRATFDGGEWRAVGVDSNGAAARSGVRAGDVVLSMGTTELNRRRTMRAGANIPTIRVRRGGSVIELKIGR